MPEHVHLLLSEARQGTLADALKSLKQGVSRRLIGEAEHFWQKRHHDFNVRNEAEFPEKLRYIHRNLVRRGLCAAAEDWEWSSFRQYATGCGGTVEIECEWAARERERAAPRLCPAAELPPQAKNGLSGPPAYYLARFKRRRTMANQVAYYANFASRFKEQIISCPEPWLWTTDMAQQGPTFHAMKRRVEMQEKLVSAYFTKTQPVLDVGCGHGRQLLLLAREGFRCLGIDYSNELLDVARAIAKKMNVQAEFVCQSLESFLPQPKFLQVMLLDVFEHLPPNKRKPFLLHIHDNVCDKSAKVLFSFPNVRFGRDTLVNFARRVTYRFPGFVNKREHPYPIPTHSEFLKQIENLFVVIDMKTNETTASYVIQSL